MIAYEKIFEKLGRIFEKNLILQKLFTKIWNSFKETEEISSCQWNMKRNF